MTAQTGQQRFYRRLIDLHCTDDATVTAWLEDDFHHFGVTVIHDGKAIVDIHAAAPRYPWTTCPGALHELRALIGKPLVRRASDIGRLLQMRTCSTSRAWRSRTPANGARIAATKWSYLTES